MLFVLYNAPMTNTNSTTKQVLKKVTVGSGFSNKHSKHSTFTHVTDDCKKLAGDDVSQFKMGELAKQGCLILPEPGQHTL